VNSVNAGHIREDLRRRPRRPTTSPWANFWREVIVPQLRAYPDGEILRRPELGESVYKTKGAIRAAGYRIRVPTGNGVVAVKDIVRVSIVHPNAEPEFPDGATSFEWPARADVGNPLCVAARSAVPEDLALEEEGVPS
jgi:hypothetical protein